MRRALALVGLLTSSCATNPVTGERELSFVSEEQEIAIGKEGAQEVAQSIGLYPDEGLQAYVAGLGAPMAAASERPRLPWSFQVVDDAAVNAFALPGGPIFVTRGILAAMGSEAELVSVLGHEIGHVAAKHSVQAISRAQLAQLGLGIGSVLSPTVAQFGQIAGAGLGVLMLKYGRDAERQADELGFRYTLEQGYDVRAMESLFETLSRVGEGGGGRLPGWLATHPDPEERLKTARERIAHLDRDPSGLKLDVEDFLSRLENIVYGMNPRQGYFEGARFRHPDLAFELELPQGWKARNQPRAVAAVSPREDAIVLLGVAGKEPPEAYARKFARQEGVRAAAPKGTEINGLPAVSTQFQATTPDGDVLEGVVVFVAHQSSTYQWLGYTAGGRLAAYETTFEKSASSFRPLTDAAALAVQPARLTLVRLAEAMTLEQFQERFPSTNPIDELALINHVQKGQPMPAGKWVKRVVGGKAPEPTSLRKP